MLFLMMKPGEKFTIKLVNEVKAATYGTTRLRQLGRPGPPIDGGSGCLRALRGFGVPVVLEEFGLSSEFAS